MNFWGKIKNRFDHITLWTLLIILYIIYSVATIFFGLEIEKHVNLNLIIYFAFAVCGLLFYFYLIKRLMNAIEMLKISIGIFSVILSIVLLCDYTYDSALSYEDHIWLSFDFYLNISVIYLMIDICLWLLVKFAEAYAEEHLNRKSDPRNPRYLKNEIEKLVSDCDNVEAGRNIKAEELYKVLKINELSIKRQKKIIRSNLLKNSLLSLLFFILGLIIPEIIMIILNL